LNNSIDDYHDLTLTFAEPPQRVISLVPSLTESLFDLGFGNTVVGITDYCIHPSEKLIGCVRIGGTKDPRVRDIITLQPDLVIANQEENSPETIYELENAGIKVWLTFPKTVRQAVDNLWVMVGIFQNKMAALRLEVLERSLDWVISASSERTKKILYFCPIWQDEEEMGNPKWMTFNRNTYMDNLLDIFGGENIFKDREKWDSDDSDEGENKRYPINRDRRYPQVTREEIISGDPDLIILPDEPFLFGETHQEIFYQIFSRCSAAKQRKILLVDGSLITWYGTRLARSLEILPSIFNQ